MSADVRAVVRSVLAARFGCDAELDNLTEEDRVALAAEAGARIALFEIGKVLSTAVEDAVLKALKGGILDAVKGGSKDASTTESVEPT